MVVTSEDRMSQSSGKKTLDMPEEKILDNRKEKPIPSIEEVIVEVDITDENRLDMAGKKMVDTAKEKMVHKIKENMVNKTNEVIVDDSEKIDVNVTKEKIVVSTKQITLNLQKEIVTRKPGAKKILSLCHKKLKSIDDEEELFRSVLITNTLKTVRKEISSKKKKRKSKKRNEIAMQLKKNLSKFGSYGLWNVWQYKMRQLVKRNQVRKHSQKI